jgi:uncharacterized membrane protein
MIGTGAKAGTQTGRRIRALDAWRGLIIVVMALDHANGFIAHGKLDPEMWTGPFPDYGGDWLAFVTRWVTHLAAPGFFFLMGAGAVLFAQSRERAGWSARRISTHIAIRGLLLMALQFTLENWAWRHGGALTAVTYIGVLFGLGGALVVAAAVVRVPAWWLAGGSVGLLIAVEITLPDTGFVARPVWQLMVLWPGFADGWWSLYPAVPWLGVAGLGMAYGRWLSRDRDRALRATLPLGLIAVAGFAAVRMLDGFGNLRPRQSGLMGLLNTVKYPPAITFLLMTLGLGLIAAWLFSVARVRRSPMSRVLNVYGSVPLFFYLAHLWLYAQMGLWIDRSGTSTGVMYFWWAAGLAVLYPACWAYGRFKASRPAGSLWRFL